MSSHLLSRHLIRFQNHGNSLLESDLEACLHNDVRGQGGETASGEDTDLIMIHYELLQETCDRGQLNYLPTLHFTDSTVAQSQPQLWRKLSLSTLLIYFTNCQSHLMGEILTSLISTLTETRPTSYRLALPECSHTFQTPGVSICFSLTP